MGLGVLPVNWFGIIFLITSFVLFILDIKAPTHGALTAAGIGSFIVGALVLFNSPGTPQFQRVSVPLVIIGRAADRGVVRRAGRLRHPRPESAHPLGARVAGRKNGNSHIGAQANGTGPTRV